MVAIRHWIGTVAAALMLLMITAVPSFGQRGGIKVEVRPDALVSQDENFQVVFTIEGTGRVLHFNWDPGDDFQLIWGPARSSSSSTTIINGKRTIETRQSYSYTLRALRTGTLPIPTASATVDGTPVTSEIGSVTVIPAEGSASAAESAEAEGGSASETTPAAGSKRSAAAKEDIFLRMVPTKKSVLIGEPFQLEIKLYTKVDISGFDGAKFPSFNDFSKQDDYAPSDVKFHREEYGGTIYYAATITRYILTPIKTGTITIEPAELNCLYSIRNASTGDPFEEFFGTGSRQVRKTLRAPAVNIEVSPLPAGAPASFDGAVGTYRMEGSISANQMTEDEAGSVTVTISGSGNIAMLKAPKLDFPQDFETYGAETQLTLDGKTSGTLRIEYPFVPRTDGEFRIGPVQFTYFDTGKRQYVTLTAGPFDLTVDENPAGVQPVGAVDASSRMGGTRVESRGESIRYIRTREPEDLGRERRFWIVAPLFWALLALALAALLIYLPLTAALARRRADTLGAKNRKAGKLARTRLKTAAGFMKKELVTAFYEELHRALLGYLSDKLVPDVADLNREGVRAALLEGGASEQTASDFIELLDACEYARYAPSAGQQSMQEHYEAAVRVLSETDASVKKTPSKKSGGARMLGLSIALLLLGPLSQAAELPEGRDTLWRSGVAAYEQGRYADAESDWLHLAESCRDNAELWYNIGDAAFQAGDNAHAVLGYERALKLDPSFEDARYNLGIVARQLDRIDAVPEFVLKRFFRNICYGLGANGWALLGAIFFLMTLAGVWLFLRSGRRGLRLTGFFGGILTLLLCAGALAFSAWQYADYADRTEAVVMKARSTVRSAPSSSGSTSLFDLHAGTKVTTLESVNGWSNIRIADGREGWIKEEDIEVI